jgi:predicted SAM-dependent methyltransferase
MHFDLHDIPLEDNQYEVIFCNHVMEHVKDDLKCMQELYRIMKPGGWGIMQVPIDSSRDTTYEDWSITSPEEREKHFWQYDHVRLYGTNYPKRLAEAGFTVEIVDYSEELPKEKFERFRIPKTELLYVIRKEA